MRATQTSRLAKKIEESLQAIEVPVIAKEVGWGISERTAKLLADCGVSAIDVAGAGGTSWSQVEMHRAPDEFTRQLAATFVGWGIPTAESIVKRKKPSPNAYLRQRRHQRRTRHRQVHRPRRDARRHGRSISQSRGGFNREGSGDDEIDEAADRGHDVCLWSRRQVEVTMFAAGFGTLEGLKLGRLAEKQT
jgi:hypothetical protein